MSAYLAYSCSTGLTKKAREEFTKGFAKDASFSLAAYSLFSLVTSDAHLSLLDVHQMLLVKPPIGW